MTGLFELNRRALLDRQFDLPQQTRSFFGEQRSQVAQQIQIAIYTVLECLCVNPFALQCLDLEAQPYKAAAIIS